MTLYSSRVPFYGVVRWDGMVVESGLTQAQAEVVAICWTGSRIREQAQHNRTNAILAAIRKWEFDWDEWPDLPALALHCASRDPALVAIALDMPEMPSASECDHARRVLERLVRLA